MLDMLCSTKIPNNFLIQDYIIILWWSNVQTEQLSTEINSFQQSYFGQRNMRYVLMKTLLIIYTKKMCGRSQFFGMFYLIKHIFLYDLHPHCKHLLFFILLWSIFSHFMQLYLCSLLLAELSARGNNNRVFELRKASWICNNKTLLQIILFMQIFC